MAQTFHIGGEGPDSLDVLSEDGERIFCRSAAPIGAIRTAAFVVVPAAEHPSRATLERLAHEFDLKDDLDPEWAVRPLELVRDRGRPMLLLEDRGGRPLEQLLGAPFEVRRFLTLAIGTSAALRQMHQAGLVHKDVKPANVMVDAADAQVRLTGFGIASRLPRERHAPEPPETIAGTLAYMAPEQTGRMNRSIDSRSDLYSLGVTFYEMLTGELPFVATNPLEWVHCHIARNPAPPHDRVKTVPRAVSSIVMKLLSKTPEERYQTASGVESDLRRCLTEFETDGHIADFIAGKHDAPDRLLIPEKLYGREREVGTLLTAFDRVVADGRSELVLLSGYSGIGKSAVVNELHKSLLPQRGLFASGKFDQYKRDIPYATLAQAFQGLIRPLLSKSEEELSPWRTALRAALEPNGQLMVNLVPELALIIGEQPVVPDLSAPESRSRFLLVLRQFLGAFTRPEHPLVLFLDDLQWLDSATLEAFEYLATDRDVRHVLLVGAYRDNEVAPQHPLRQRLKTIRDARGGVDEIALGPIRPHDVTAMMADALGAKAPAVAPLARLVFEKAGGNPFFTVQFLGALADDGLLTFDAQAAAWRWNIDQVRAKSVSDNVVDLMVERLKRLPDASLGTLKRMACLGNSVESRRFQRVIGASEEEMHRLLHEPLRAGLLLQVGTTCSFAHDRVHEAAYALLQGSERAEAHRGIGTHLMATLSESEVDAEIFDIASHFNRGDITDTNAKQRAAAASLNLRAGRKAKASAAYGAACDYLAKGRAHLGADGWNSHYALAFALAIEQAECTFLNGDFDGADTMATGALDHAKTRVDKAAIHRLRIELHVVRSDNAGAVQSALTALGLCGIDFSSPHPSRDEVEREFANVWTNLGGRPFECIADLPSMTDPEMLAAMRILAELWAPAYFTDFNLATLVGCRMVNISLIHGAANTSNQGYALLGLLMGPAFGLYHDGYRLAALAGELAERHHVLLNMARVGNTLALAASWTQPLTTAIDRWRKAYRTGVEAGDLYFTCFSAGHIGTHLLLRGQNLQQAGDECKAYVEAARRTGFEHGTDMIVSSERAIACLRGLTRGLTDFSDDAFDESTFAARLTGSRIIVATWYYWTRKVMLHFLAGDYRGALAAADKVQPGPRLKIIQVQHMDLHYYSALSLAALSDTAPADERVELRKRLDDHQSQLKLWAEETRSPTFADKHVLIAAEIARLDERELEAQVLYERSIRLAHENGFLQHEAVAYETAARFYARRGFESFAQLYVREARYRYQRWGADAKVRQLDALHPFAPEDRQVAGPAETTVAAMEHLDLATVIKVSQVVSAEMVLDKLLDTLMRTAMEHAGAGRAVLILSRGGEQRVEAEAVVHAGAITVELHKAAVSSSELPESVVQYVTRTGDTVVLGDASARASLASDPYLARKGVRSLLCLPLMTRARLIGVLYLENELSTQVFTADRVAVLKLLASQAAVSLENTRLYGELEEREARIRRLVDSNIIGIVIWDLDGRILDANDAFLRMVGYDRDDLKAGLGWLEITPPEWQDVHARYEAEELKTTGMMQAREKEYFRKDGSRVPVLIGAACFEDQPTQGVAYILDLTERKRAEETARQSEQRYRAVKMELAHANRVATVGQLTGSIAHEVSQPIAATVASAQAAVRWLEREPPDLDKARRSLARIVQDGERASEVVQGIRALMKKAPPRWDRLEINGPIGEVIELTRSEAIKNGVFVKTDFAEGLPSVRGDHVQIRQVMLNLVVNAIEAMGGVIDGVRELTIGTEPADSGDILVTVRDSGPGLGRENSERVFDAFYTTKSAGLGMGLSICRSIIEGHGGRMWASANQPRGAVFQFTLPPSEGSVLAATSG